MRRRVLACAVLVCLGLAGCRAGEPQPIEPSAHRSDAPSAAPTSSLTPPPMPKVAKQNDATGAANFVLYWVKVSNYAALTGDTDLLREISAPDCEGCNRYIKLYEKTYADGGYFKGGNWTLSSPRVSQSDGRIDVFAHISAPAGKYKTRRAASERHGTAENTDMVFEAQTSRGRWLLSQLVLKSEWTE